MDLKFILEYVPHTHQQSTESMKSSMREEKCSTQYANPLPRKIGEDDEEKKIENTTKKNFLSTKSVCKRFQNPCNARNDYIKFNEKESIESNHLPLVQPVYLIFDSISLSE